MRERLILCRILWKRLLGRKFFWLLLCLIPLAVTGMQALARKGETMLRAAVYTPDRAQWEEALCKDTGLVRFYFCDTPEQLKQDVIQGKAECGYVLAEDLRRRFEEDDWYWAVEVYESSGSMMTEVVNETVFGRIFQTVSSEWFVGLMQSRMNPGPEEDLWEQDEVWEVLRRKLEDGSTFSVEIIRGADPAAEGTGDPAGGVFPARGIAAALLYVCALMGAMDALRDRRKGYFKNRFPAAAAVFAVGLPVGMGACVGYGALLAAGACRGIGRECFALVVYALLLTGYGCALQFFLRRENILAGCIPFLFLACLVCTPVFIDLSSIVPGMRIWEKCFPASFYLRGF